MFRAMTIREVGSGSSSPIGPLISLQGVGMDPSILHSSCLCGRRKTGGGGGHGPGCRGDDGDGGDDAVVVTVVMGMLVGVGAVGVLGVMLMSWRWWS